MRVTSLSMLCSDTSGIVFIEAQRDPARAECVQVNVDGKGHLCHQRLVDLERQLDPARFVAVDGAYILNLAWVASMQRGVAGNKVLLADGSVVPVSRRGYDKLRRLIGATAPDGRDRDIAATPARHSADALASQRIYLPSNKEFT